jgi:hypothetical protein
VTNTFPQRWILGNQHVTVGSTGISMDNDALCVRGHSDQNEVNRSSDQNRERPECSQ